MVEVTGVNEFPEGRPEGRAVKWSHRRDGGGSRLSEMSLESIASQEPREEAAEGNVYCCRTVRRVRTKRGKKPLCGDD